MITLFERGTIFGTDSIITFGLQLTKVDRFLRKKPEVNNAHPIIQLWLDKLYWKKIFIFCFSLGQPKYRPV